MKNYDIELPQMPESISLLMGDKVLEELAQEYARCAIEYDRYRTASLNPKAWRVGNELFLTEDEARGSIRNPDLKPIPLCDCERGHNGTGMAVRKCDCDAMSQGEHFDRVYPTNKWVEEFFGNPDEQGFYHFRGDFGGVAYRYQKAARYADHQDSNHKLTKGAIDMSDSANEDTRYEKQSTTEKTIEQHREDFEEWTINSITKEDDGLYVDYHTEIEWQSWLAARGVKE